MSQSYSVSHYELIEKMEKTHFWYRERNQVTRLLIARFIKEKQQKTFLEVGCGTGTLLPIIESLGLSVTGMDVNYQAINVARERSGAHLIRSSFFSYTGKKRFDAIGVFDTLEHQRKDVQFLIKCHKTLKNGGYLFISVPSHQWLWSNIDAVSGHIRRYEKKDMIDKLKKTGFSICFCNHWNILLFGWYFLWRVQFYGRDKSGDTDRYLLTPPSIVNTLCRLVLSLERPFFFNIPFPFGSSLFLVAKRG